MSPATPPVVTLRRTGAATSAMLASALVAHTSAGGSLPPASVLAVVLALLALVGLVVTRRDVGRWGSLALVGGGQLVVHEVLTVTSGWAVAGPDHAGMSAGAHVHGQVTTGAVHTSGGAAAVDDLRMVVLHVVATLVTGWVLTQGDRVVAAVVAAVSSLWRALVLSVLPPVGTLEKWVPTTHRVATTSVVCVRRRPRRGPPRALGVALVQP